MDTYTVDSVDLVLNKMTDAVILEMYLLMFKDNKEELEVLTQKVSKVTKIAEQFKEV
jgi:hypothetical protein